MLGKDSKKNIQFPVQKQGTPSVVVLEDFFNEEFIREANNDFEEFIKKSSEVDFLSFGETRKNLSSRGSRYCLLYTSPSPRDKRLSRMPSSA